MIELEILTATFRTDLYTEIELELVQLYEFGWLVFSNDHSYPPESYGSIEEIYSNNDTKWEFVKFNSCKTKAFSFDYLKSLTLYPDPSGIDASLTPIQKFVNKYIVNR